MKTRRLKKLTDILMKNRTTFMSTLRSQSYICNYLLQHGVLTSDDCEQVLCKDTNSRRNVVLIDFILCRPKYGFDHFCDALRKSCQIDLLELLDKDYRGSEGKCSVCLQASPRVAFGPCGHVTVCTDCANRLDRCPLCRAEINIKLQVFI